MDRLEPDLIGVAHPIRFDVALEAHIQRAQLRLDRIGDRLRFVGQPGRAVELQRQPFPGPASAGSLPAAAASSR